MMFTSVVTGATALSSTLQIPLEGVIQSTGGDDKWAYLGAILTTLIAPLIIILVNKRTLQPPTRNRRNSRNNEEEDSGDDTVSTSRGTSFSTEGMSANMAQVLLVMWQKMEEMEDTQKSMEERQAEWAAERVEFIRINEELRRHNRALAEGFDEVIDWIDRGATPPPPSVAQHVRDLVQRTIENGTSFGEISGN